MITAAVITRRLKEGKTYEDFRKAWYHRVGFGTSNRMFTLVNVSDPREITVIGLTETDVNEFLGTARIDVRERAKSPLDDVIEPEIHRSYGLLISEDDFSAAGAIEYKPPSVGGKVTDLGEVASEVQKIAQAVAEASRERDLAKAGTTSSRQGK